MDAGAGQAMDAQVTLVLASDGVAPLEALVGQLMSPMNDQRGQAEQLFNYCKQRRADALVLKMIQALQVTKRCVMKVSSVMILKHVVVHWFLPTIITCYYLVPHCYLSQWPGD
jgi:hypothetical protein